MKYTALIFFLLCFYLSSGQVLKESDLIGSWTCKNYRISKWGFKENTTVELNGKNQNKIFIYYLDSAENELQIHQFHTEAVDTIFIFKIMDHNLSSIRLNFYKKIPYSLITEKPKKEIIIPNNGIAITLLRNPK